MVNGDAVDGFMQIAGCRGRKEQFKCFGQGSWVRLKYLKQRKSKLNGKAKGAVVCDGRVQNGKCAVQIKGRMSGEH